MRKTQQVKTMASEGTATARREEPGPAQWPTRQIREGGHESPGQSGRPAAAPERVTEADNLVLEHLKRIQAELSAARERDEVLLARMSALEGALLSVKRELLHGEEADARQQIAIGRILHRVDRIERRLELTE